MVKSHLLPWKLSLIFIVFSVVTNVFAQDVCSSGPSEIIISFPEIDPPRVPTNDSIYKQVVTNGLPFNITIDPDAGNSYSMSFNDYFVLEANNVQKNYAVRMIKGIDRDGPTTSGEDDINILEYLLVCQNNQSYSRTSKVLKIQINDVNDNSPQFFNAPYTISVNELTPVGVTVFSGIGVTDLDEGPFKQIAFSLTPGYSQFGFNGVSYFYLPSDAEGILSVKSPLDFEAVYSVTGDISKTFYNITVIARDNTALQGGQPSRTNKTTLQVLITDGDDQGPEFIYPSCIINSQPYSKSCVRPKYLASIASGNFSEISLTFLPDPPNPSDPSPVNIIMQDRDTLNSPVNCSILKTEPAGYEIYFTARASKFSGKQYRCEINKKMGFTLFRNNISSLEIVVEAVEISSNYRVDYATVVVSIHLVNLSPPIIKSNSNIGYIYENSPVGARAFTDQTANTTIMKLTFTDPDTSSTDPPAQFEISLTGVLGTNSLPFSVTQDGYVVVNNAVLDYEQMKQYSFKVIIIDKTPEKFESYITITINVLNVNDNGPVIVYDEPFVSIPQGEYNQSLSFTTLQATDVDFGPLVFSLSRVAPSNQKTHFYVGKDGGISFQGSLRAGDVYTIYVNIADQGIPTRSIASFVSLIAIINQTTYLTGTAFFMCTKFWILQRKI